MAPKIPLPNGLKDAHQLLCLVAARAASDPDTPIRVFLPEFAQVPSLLTMTRSQWMREPSEIDDRGLPGAFLLYPNRQLIMRTIYRDVRDSKALAAFIRDCWAIYCSNNTFRVSRLGDLSALLGWQCGGGEVMKRWLKTIYITISMAQLLRVEKETGDSKARWVGEHLDELFECASLERVTRVEGLSREIPRLDDGSLQQGGAAVGGRPPPEGAGRQGQVPSLMGVRWECIRNGVVGSCW
jgi:hypothetical protein